MARIRGRNTGPELATRSSLHHLGYRFRVHVRDLPGTPDIAIKSRRVVIFVHGCFWHLHEGCRFARPPKENTGYWGPKLRRNVERDLARSAELDALGYRVLVVWECETGDAVALAGKLDRFMRERPP